MSIITAYKSDADGKIFEDKSKYTAHLRKLARHRNEQRKLTIAEDAKDAAWAELYEREQSIDDWMQMVIDNQHLFWAEAAAGNRHDWERVGMKLGRGKNAGNLPMPRVLKIKHSLRWSDSVSNSHSCPVGGVTCWSSHEAKDGRPRGYPGWTGHIDWLVEWPKEFDGIYIGSDLFSKGSFRSGRQRAHTGTGGGGGGGFVKEFNTYCQHPGYDFRIFASDWLGLYRYEMRKQWLAKENADRLHNWRAIGGKGLPTAVTEVPADWAEPRLEFA
jgi:hypothetical protein